MTTRHIATLILCAAIAGCAAEEDVTILAEIATDPYKPLPGHAPELTATVTGDGSPLRGATVTAEAQMGDTIVEPVTLTEGDDGVYSTSDLVMPDEGDWTVVLSVDSSDGAASFEQDVTVTCGAERTVGSECCESANCAAGLWCDANLCSDQPRPVGEACETLDQCIAGLWCQDGACSDQPRPNGTVCDESAQCLSAYCVEGVCIDPPWSILGKGDGSPGSVGWTDVLSVGLDGVTDLAFNPDGDNELWITCANTDSLHVVHNPGEPNQTQEGYFDSSRHFLEEVIALSFGDNTTFATCGDTRNTYDDLYFEQMDFMGPVLWPSIEQDFKIYGPSAHEAHLDMLHSSPECMGIAAAGGNTFFTFNGYDKVLGWYDFKEPHPDTPTGHGGEDHSDGKKWVFEDVPLTRVDGVPGHMVYDFDTGLLYVADSGASRVIEVDTSTASWSGALQSWWGDGTLEKLTGTTVVEIVQPMDGIVTPSGLALHDGVLYISDHATGWIHAYTLDGEHRNSLDTGFGPQAVGGITAGPDGKLYIVDMANDRVLRVDG